MAFIEDVLDAHIIGAGMQHFGMETIESTPSRVPLPEEFQCWGEKAQTDWLLHQADAVLNSLLPPTDMEDSDFGSLQITLESQDNLRLAIDEMKTGDGTYKCNQTDCSKHYRREGNLKRHLRSVHNWVTDIPHPQESSRKATAQVIKGSFVKQALIARDTWDAYKMGDGDRAIRNAKFEMLYASAAGHWKYRQWLFRMLAYEKAILTPRHAFEYKWNISANLQGQAHASIPGDNLVELQVGSIKRKLQSQGANVTFSSAQTAAKTTQVVDMVKNNLSRENASRKKGTSRHQVDKSADVHKLCHELMHSDYFTSNNHLPEFTNMSDTLCNIDARKLDVFMCEQKKALAGIHC